MQNETHGNFKKMFVPLGATTGNVGKLLIKHQPEIEFDETACQFYKALHDIEHIKNDISEIRSDNREFEKEVRRELRHL